MFGKNPIEKAELDQPGLMLRVVAGAGGIFYTIQGEGPFSGRPAVFLRLHGCPLRCFFCDTEFSGKADPILSVGEIVDKICAASPAHLREEYFLGDRPLRPLVVITGGEPTRQNLSPLIAALVNIGFQVQVETAGIFWQTCLRWQDVSVVVSPKTPHVHEEIARTAVAYKYVIRAGDTGDDGLPIASTQIEGEKAFLARPPRGVPVYVSPMDEQDAQKNAANTAEVARVAMAHGYIAMLQVHKYLGLA